MSIKHEEIQQYAKLLLVTGVNLQKGQSLSIRHSPGALELARVCAETAYQMGAINVELQLRDQRILKSRIASQSRNPKALRSIPGWLQEKHRLLVEEKWCYLVLDSHDDTGIMSCVNQEDFMIYEKNQLHYFKYFKEAILSHKISWCISAYPSVQWAKRVLGPNADLDDLWRALRPILRLDRDNPIQAWQDHSRLLNERAEKLNMFQLKSLHFTDRETDLRVGLNKNSFWIGGAGRQANKIITMPNLPTEEVFTTPNRLQCNGIAAITRPVEIRGTVIKGAVLKFKDGILYDLKAREGEETFRSFVETDPGAKRLGEVALVGIDNPIAQSGHVFYSILYDENAACHIALGAGYNSGMREGADLSNQNKQEAAGCNHSMVHQDFMISSPTTNVTGYTEGDNQVKIITNGHFVI